MFLNLMRKRQLGRSREPEPKYRKKYCYGAILLSLGMVDRKRKKIFSLRVTCKK